jgi:FkbM family methyltransferase
VRNKSRLLKIALLQSIPEKVKCFFGLNRKIEEVIKNQWNGITVEIDGIKYVLVDSESFDIVNESESFILAWLKPKKGEVFLDVGAHIGKYTLKMAREVGETGLVIAVEPNPDNYQMLQKGIALNNVQNVIALNMAAWNAESMLKLFIGHLAGHHSAKIDWKLGWCEVKARPMDNVIEECGINKVDWIKIDVEGAEWEVLLGLEKTISKHRSKVIVELSHENVGKVKEFMKKERYGIIKISSTFEGIIYGVPRKYAYFLLLPL